MNKKYLTKEAALKKAQRYCAYQDRCHQEVRYKLLEWGVYGDTLEEVLVELIEERFLDEERFARSFARGKFRMRQWGRDRIRRELKQRQISAYCLRKALEEIDEADYLATLESILEKRLHQYATDRPFERNQKSAAYAIRRGYEVQLVWETLRGLNETQNP